MATLLERQRAESDRQWVEHLLRTWAKTFTGDTIAVKFVNDAVLDREGAVAIYRPADKLRAPRIELKSSLIYNPSELLRSYFHELGHHVQRSPQYRRKSWIDEERDAERFGQNMERKVSAACRKHGKSVAQLLRYPDD